MILSKLWKGKKMKFSDAVSACEYMGEKNPQRLAWVEGPFIGALRVEYVKTHKAHIEAVESGDIARINATSFAYKTASNALTDALHMY